MPRPLCVLLPEIGVLSETFLHWDIHRLFPGGTVVIADPPPAGATVTGSPAWTAGDCPVLTLTPRLGDPPPSAAQGDAVIQFLANQGTEVVLVEYLDFADRWFDLLRQLGVRIWLRGHGVDHSARLRQPYWQAAYQRYADADGILVPSWIAAETLVRTGLPASKIHVVGYPVELPTEVTPDGAERHIRCVMVGRLVEKKAPLLSLQAFHAAARRVPQLTLDVVGDGPLREDVAAYLVEYGIEDRVRLRGPLSHDATLRLVRASDLLLHHAVTSPVDGDAEGLPVVILEAMAAGVPVLATRHAGIPEVVTDGVNGRLVTERDVTAMAQALVELAGTPAERARLGHAARATIAERHTTHVVGDTLRGLLGLPSSEESP